MSKTTIIKCAYFAIFISIGILLTKVIVSNAGVQVKLSVESQTEQWTGTLEDGSLITDRNIFEILTEHKKWLETNGKEGKKINLKKANLEKAFLENADLKKAVFNDCNLSGAVLNNADLSDAALVKTDLSSAKLKNSKLINTFLFKIDLSGSDFQDANLGGATFHPDTFPAVESIASAKNLSKVRYHEIPEKLVKLRQLFKDSGLLRQEREITFAIKHKHRLDLGSKYKTIWNKIESIFYLIFFEWPCAYGLKPGRPLLIIIILIIPMFSIPYIFVLNRPMEKDGIWKVWLIGRIRQDLGCKTPTLLRLKFLPAIAYGFYFSVLSTFSIGWRDFNVGNWITRIQKQEYTLRASGWVRTISGIQSVISVYLLALGVLTYFSQPFETF